MTTAQFTYAQLGRAVRVAADHAMSVSVSGSLNVLFVVYGARVRRVDAGPGWASRMWDAMQELRPELRAAREG